MYERFIEALESYRNVLDKGDEVALEAAIAMMRAAQPEDEAAERAHCERVTSFNGHVMRFVADLLLCERAAARAEGSERLIAQIETLKDDKAAMYAQAERNVAELRELRRELRCLQSYPPGSSGFYETLINQLRADVGARQARIDALGARLERLGYGPDEEP